jgi:hypothetical protein
MMRVRLRGFALAVLGLLALAPAAEAVPIYIAPFTIGKYEWKDLDGRCVAACPHQFTCPCWPTRLGDFWIP